MRQYVQCSAWMLVDPPRSPNTDKSCILPHEETKAVYFQKKFTMPKRNPVPIRSQSVCRLFILFFACRHHCFILKKTVSSPLNCLFTFVKKSTNHVYSVHWSMCLFFCQNHAVLITVILQQFLKLGRARLSRLSPFFRVASFGPFASP